MKLPPGPLGWQQAALGAGTLALGALLAFGATTIGGEAGYGGVGPNFLPFVVSGALMLCGALLLGQALTGGFRNFEAPPEEGPGARADWRAGAWVAAGICATALLITRVGFIVACTVCFVLAVRGLRLAEGKPHGGVAGLLRDVATGALIAAPAFWVFTKLLGINLPNLTGTSWL